MLGRALVFDPCNELNDPVVFVLSYEVDVSRGLNVRIFLLPKDEFAVRPYPPNDQRKGCKPALRGLS